jgi:hypothetical protein
VGGKFFEPINRVEHYCFGMHISHSEERSGCPLPNRMSRIVETWDINLCESVLGLYENWLLGFGGELAFANPFGAVHERLNGSGCMPLIIESNVMPNFPFAHIKG